MQVGSVVLSWHIIKYHGNSACSSYIRIPWSNGDLVRHCPLCSVVSIAFNKLNVKTLREISDPKADQNTATDFAFASDGSFFQLDLWSSGMGFLESCQLAVLG